MKLTLDWNCVIEVEDNRPQAYSLQRLVESHRSGKVDVALLGASASENTREKRLPSTFHHFQMKIEDLGWSDLPIVPMPCVIGLTYIGRSFIVGDADLFKRDVNAIWEVIAPNVPRSPRDIASNWEESKDIGSEDLARWRNVWCDVMSAYSHIKAGRDVFVTNNTRDFQSKSTPLSKLGMKRICTPDEAVNLVR